MKMKEVQLPSGGKVQVADDGRPFKISKRADGADVVDYGSGGRVVFKTSDGASGAAHAAKPQISLQEIADGITKTVGPIIKRQNEKLALLEARIALLEAERR